MKITDHLQHRHKQYAIYDNYRSIANYLDGFKSSSRKLFYCLDDFKKFSKVDTIANATALKTQYLHGSVNLEGVVTGLSQTYAGTNILPIYETEGFFGNRVMPLPGASRYIKAKKNPIIDYLYRPEDYEILIKQEFEGYPIEPRFYMPILPAVLLNSQSGIGNGYSQTIYSRNIGQLIKYIQAKLSDSKLPKLLPYFEGFKGSISKGDNINQYNIRGKLTVVNTTTIEISELPINSSIEKYIKFLTELEDSKVIKDFKDRCNKNTINFEIRCLRELTKEPLETLYKIFKLNSTISETLTCIGENNQIIVFEDVYAIIDAFCEKRLEYYTLRKNYTIAQYEKELVILKNKIKFIEGVHSGYYEINNKQKTEIEFALYNSYIEKVDDSYDYLLNLRIYSLTYEKLQELKEELKTLESALEGYKLKAEKDIWIEELKELSKKLPKQIQQPEEYIETKTINKPKMLLVKSAKTDIKPTSEEIKTVKPEFKKEIDEVLDIKNLF